jgi:hypothetical protein
MRRRLELFIPIVLLAVLVQLIAPVGAFCAVAHAVSDPLGMAPICSEMTTAEPQTMPSHAPNAHAVCCAFCAAGHSGSAAIDPPAPVFVILQRQYQRVVWLEAIHVMSTVRVGSNAQARSADFFLTWKPSRGWCGDPRRLVPLYKLAIAPAAGLSDVSLSCLEQREHACALQRAFCNSFNDKSADGKFDASTRDHRSAHPASDGSAGQKACRADGIDRATQEARCSRGDQSAGAAGPRRHRERIAGDATDQAAVSAAAGIFQHHGQTDR